MSQTFNAEQHLFTHNTNIIIIIIIEVRDRLEEELFWPINMNSCKRLEGETMGRGQQFFVCSRSHMAKSW